MSDAEEIAWLANVIAINNGKAYCLPPGMKLAPAANVISSYVAAHPEWDGKVDESRINTALSASFPCSTSGGSNQNSTQQVGGNTVNVEVAPKGEYATIDTRLAVETIRQLQNIRGHENDELIATIEKNSGDYAPPVLFVLARLLYKQGESEDAYFWFNAARLRGNFDAARCADESAKSAIAVLVAQIPVDLRREEFNDLDKLKDIIHRVVQWDETTPYHYDHRWINLHGMGAITAGTNNANGTSPAMSVPEDQWPELAKKMRDDYLDSLDKAIEIVSKRRATK